MTAKLMIFIALVTLTILLVTTKASMSATKMSLPEAFWGDFSASASGSYLYAAETNNVDGSFPNVGNIYYSHNGGTTWELSTAPANGWNKLASDSSGRYVLATGLGTYALYYSSDYGVSWNTVSLSLSSLVNSCAMSNTGEVMISTCDNSGFFFYSTNFGLNWTSVLGPPGATTFNNNAVAVDNIGTTIVSSVSSQGLYLSSNGGVSWSLQYASSANIASVAYGGGYYYAVVSTFPWYLLTSSDGGTVWTNGTGFTGAMNTISIDYTGSKLLVSGSNGLWYSSNGGNSFANVYYYAGDQGTVIAQMNSNANVTLWSLPNATVFPPPGYVYLSNASLFKIPSVEPTMSPTRSPSQSAPTAEPTHSSTSISPESTPCPTSCPVGYTGTAWTNGDVVVYCKDEPTLGQCVPGGSGCTSSCHISTVAILVLVFGSLIFCCGIGGVWYCYRRRRSSRPMAEALEPSINSAL